MQHGANATALADPPPKRLKTSSAVDHGPEAADIDASVLAELPMAVRKEVEKQMRLAAASAKGGARGKAGIGRFFARASHP